VFHTTAANITINGLAPGRDALADMLTASSTTRSIEQHEPFDPRLWERAKELARQEEDLVEEIAALRRRMPGVAVEGARSGFKDGVEADERVLRERLEAAERDGGLVVGKMERQEEVERAWERGVQGLGRLKRTMPEMVARKEKAERVEQYVLQMK
jgi:kinetochor protein Mis14/NSL1